MHRDVPEAIQPVLKPPLRRSWSLPAWRQVWFQLHWFIGITAGTVLIVIGVSGAVLAFRDELIDAINPGGRQVAPRTTSALAVPQLLDTLKRDFGDRKIGTLAVWAQPGSAARVIFAPAKGERRGETVYLDPYTGAALPALVGAEFFEWVEHLHRWLLLPRDQGQLVVGWLATGLLFLSLSGLYLRWPRRPLAWRAWLTFDTRLKGRSFLWGLHSVLGTLALLMYLMVTTTGIYWAFDTLRDQLDAWAASPRVAATANAAKLPKAEPTKAVSLDIAPAWTVFEQQAASSGGWSQVIVRLPTSSAPSVLFTWLAADPEHNRARNRMTVLLPDGTVSQDERYAAKSRGGRLLASVYPLHMGSYFGLPGRIAMMLAALMLPVFAVTGWMLYLDRRRKKRLVRSERAARDVIAAGSNAATADRVLLVFASQSGTAEGLALRSAAALEAAGVPVELASLAHVAPAQLQTRRRLLIVASTFGEGEPPDATRLFMRQLAQIGRDALAPLQYGLLALGDRHYANFCGFGHQLDQALQAAGAQALFPPIEVDNGDPAALARWSAQLSSLAGGDAELNVEAAVEPLQRWQLTSRQLLNPGSQGDPLYQIELSPEDGQMPAWAAGALVELLPRQAPAAVAAALSALGRPADDTLAETLSRSELPGGSGQWVALAPRRYSVASLPQNGALRLLVRQSRGAAGLGIASGWLTEYAALQTTVELRLLANPGFEAVDTDAPCIFIGNGSGYAGLRGHLLTRIANGGKGPGRNWLLFGERERAHDAFCAEELAQWQAKGHLERVDLVFSRDQAERLYVQDRLREAAAELRLWTDAGAVIYVCGSLDGMATGVDSTLVEILGRTALDALIDEGRYRRDVY